ncbi:MAG: hypothetical protein HPY74_19875 [Firmicutes bacterium]|nr:hypothetical protein [Bacillota bacterium]
MTNNLPETKKDVEELLQEFPELQRFNNRMKTIEALAKDAEKETELTHMADSFKTVLRLQEQLFAEIIRDVIDEFLQNFEGMADNCQEWKAIAEKLGAALKKEREIADKIFDSLCVLMLEDPRGTFENIILRQVERRQKIESSDGWDNWQWGLHFPLIARIRMAWKLVFGREEGYSRNS